jgi:hypothetical protein
MGLIGSPETSVLNRTTLRNNPEEGRNQWIVTQLRAGNAQSDVFGIYVI